MVDKLKEIKTQMYQAEDFATADRLFTRLAMIVRNSHLREDSKKSYCDKIASFELSKMASQEILMKGNPFNQMAFEKFKGDADSLLDVIIEEEELSNIK